jgi:hypothetical protein
MLRDTLLATVTALVVVGAYLISEALPPTSQPWPDAALRAALDRRIPGEVHIRGSFRDAIAQLVALGCPINMHDQKEWPYVEKNTRTPIDLRLRDATLEQWLQSIAFQLVEGDLAYWADLKGVIHVSAPWRQRPPLATRVYDVRDLPEMESAFAALFPQPNLDPSGEPAVIDPAVFADWGWGSIIENIGGGYTWIIRGGGTFSGREVQVGDMDFRDGRLIITHTPEVHRRMSALLAVIRARPGLDEISERSP